MAKKQEILQELATWVAETVDIAKIIATHNKGLPQEDPAYVVPIDNKSASIKQKTRVPLIPKDSTGPDTVP